MLHVCTHVHMYVCMHACMFASCVQFVLDLNVLRIQNVPRVAQSQNAETQAT